MIWSPKSLPDKAGSGGLSPNGGMRNTSLNALLNASLNELNRNVSYNNYDVDIIEFNSSDSFNNNMFNFISAIYLDSNTVINFSNIINTNGYNYILFDDQKIYKIDKIPQIVINKVNRFGFLYNFNMLIIK